MSEMFTDTETHTMRTRGGSQIHACMRTDPKNLVHYVSFFLALEEACLSTFCRHFNSVQGTQELNTK